MSSSTSGTFEKKMNSSRRARPSWLSRIRRLKGAKRHSTQQTSALMAPSDQHLTTDPLTFNLNSGTNRLPNPMSVTFSMHGDYYTMPTRTSACGPNAQQKYTKELGEGFKNFIRHGYQSGLTSNDDPLNDAYQPDSEASKMSITFHFPDKSQTVSIKASKPGAEAQRAHIRKLASTFRKFVYVGQNGAVGGDGASTTASKSNIVNDTQSIPTGDASIAYKTPRDLTEAQHVAIPTV